MKNINKQLRGRLLLVAILIFISYLPIILNFDQLGLDPILQKDTLALIILPGILFVTYAVICIIREKPNKFDDWVLKKSKYLLFDVKKISIDLDQSIALPTIFLPFIILSISYLSISPLFLIDWVNFLIIILFALTIVIPQVIDRFKNKKKLIGEIQAELESKGPNEILEIKHFLISQVKVLNFPTISLLFTLVPIILQYLFGIQI